MTDEVINLKATPEINAIKLSWGVSSTSYLTGFDIIVTVHGVVIIRENGLPANTRDFIVKNLESNTKYSFNVRADVEEGGKSVEAAPTAPPISTPPSPVLVVNGNTISWTAISGATNYELATIMNPGTTRNTTYSTVTGTSVTPPVVPGETVNYGLSVKTPVVGHWAKEVSISYPASTPPSPPLVPAAKPIIGLNNLTGWGRPQMELLQKLGFRSERIELGGPYTKVKETVANGNTRLPVIVGNINDGIRLSSINISDWVTKTITEIKSEVLPYTNDIAILECINEPYLKGGVAEPVIYADMFVALKKALISEDINLPLAFNAFGKYATGKFWIADAVAAQQSILTLSDGFIHHPYGHAKEDLNQAWGPGALEECLAEAKKLGFKNIDFYATEFGIELGGKSGASINVGTEKEQASVIKAVYEELLAIPEIMGIWYYQTRDDSQKFGLVTTDETVPAGIPRLSLYAVSSFIS